VSEQPEEKYIPKDASYASIAPSVEGRPKGEKGILYATCSIVGLIFLARFRRKEKNS
jgi:hypothetical protein